MKLEEKMMEAQKKQRKMGKLLVKKIEENPPSLKRRSIISWSDVLTADYLKALKKNSNPTVKNEVEECAFNYAKSINESRSLIKEETKGKSFKEKKEIIALWKKCQNMCKKKKTKTLIQK